MRNLHKEITDRIIAQLKNGVVPWKRPWSESVNGSFPRNAISNRGYSGVNVMLLWSEAAHKGYDHPLWLTYKQAVSVGGNVRKGEHGVQIVYLSRFVVKPKSDDDKPKSIGFLKTYTVFNVAQCENLPTKYQGVREAKIVNHSERNEDAEAFIVSTGADIGYGGSRAFFSPTVDHVQMPVFESFVNADKYYGTMFHELTHWTGAKSRLDRNFSTARFGNDSYSAEELVAELGSAFLCSEFGFDNDEANASYIDHWIQFLTDHEQALITASSAASKAVDFLRSKALAEDDDNEELDIAA